VTELKKQGLTAVMFSFLYHPGNLFSDKEFELIYTEEEKLKKLKKTDIDVLISYPFTQETRSMEPEDFIKEVLINRLDTKVIVVGTDYRFGHNKRGDVELLSKFERTFGYKLIVCEKRKWNDTIISSSEIRNELKAGNIEAANAMLGQPYSILGTVMHGRKIGRTLGMPTVNIIPDTNKLLPPNGVYASKTLADGVYYPGVTNIGFKPTVGGEERKGVETYIFDFDQDLYGKEIEVELYTYQRPERKFASLEELKFYMHQDIEKTAKYFNIR
jgi:riboflavin kinase/FMN adenylyltransferase